MKTLKLVKLKRVLIEGMGKSLFANRNEPFEVSDELAESLLTQGGKFEEVIEKGGKKDGK